MIDGVVISAVAVLVIVGGSGGFLLHRTRRAADRARASSADSGVPSGAEQAAAFERLRVAIQDLLRGVSGSIDGLRGTASKYDTSLREHRASLEKMATIQDLRELEHAMLAQVKDVQAANETYRRQLDQANAKVQEQQQELEQLQANVGVDALTEIPNRRAFDERLEELMGRSQRYGNEFALIVFDIDHFKDINDRRGHAAGDRILRAVAHVLDDLKRSSDFLARYGGEEFVLLLPETSMDAAQRFATRTLERVAGSKFQYQKHLVRVTLSAGVGILEPGTDTAETLFARVDAALYRAKEGGRNRVELAEATSSE